MKEEVDAHTGEKWIELSKEGIHYEQDICINE